MSLNIVEIPYSYFPDFSRGRPLYNASIYVGVVDTDPEQPINQKPVTLRQEDGTEIPAAQPILTSSGGVPIYNGGAVTILVDGSYSVKVLDNQGNQEYYSPDVTKGIPVTEETLPELLPEFLPIYTDIVYKASGGNSAVENMIAGIPLTAKVGDTCSTGLTTWRPKVSPQVSLSDFEVISEIYAQDFGTKEAEDSLFELQSAIDYATSVNKSVFSNSDITIEGDIDLTCPLRVRLGLKIKQQSPTGSIKIYSKGALVGGGEVDVSGVTFTGEAVKLDPSFNGKSYDWASGTGNKMNSDTGVSDFTIITDSSYGDGIGNGTGLLLRCYDEAAGNSYISWCFFSKVRIIGKFQNGLHLDRESSSKTWINGNFFDNILVDKAINKIVGANANTFNTWNNVITQPSTADLPQDRPTVDLDGGYTQSYNWDGDKIALGGGIDVIQRISPSDIFLGGSSQGASGLSNVNLIRGRTDSAFYQRRGLIERFGNLNTLIPFISGGRTSRAARGNRKFERHFGQSLDLFKNTTEIEVNDAAVDVNSTFGLVRKSFNDGDLVIPGQHLSCSRSNGSSLENDFIRFWWDRGGVVRADSPFIASINFSISPQGGRYSAGFGQQDNGLESEISDGVYIELDSSLSTSSVSVVSYSGGTIRQRVEYDNHPNLFSGQYLISAYFIGIGSEIKVGWQFNSATGESANNTDDYMNFLFEPSNNIGPFKWAAMATNLTTELLAPFVQIDNVDGGQPNMFLHSIESAGHITKSAT